MPDVKIRVTYSCRDCRQEFDEVFEGSAELFKFSKDFIQFCPHCGSRDIVHIASDPINDPPGSQSP